MSQSIEQVIDHHIMPIRSYLAVFSALVFLTGVTVGVSYLNLGPTAILAALAVALVKAGFVVGYFMHLKFEDRFLSVVFFGSVVFLLIFFVFTFIDLDSRGALLPEQDTMALKQQKALVERLNSEIEAATATAAPAPAEEATEAAPAEEATEAAPAEEATEATPVEPSATVDSAAKAP